VWLRWDWFNSVAPVPYVPTLGPVHPHALTPRLLAEVQAVNGTGAFLPYDKDRRWAAVKDETILIADVVHTPHETVIPTLTRRRGGMLNVHYYGRGTPDLQILASMAARWSAKYRVAAARVLWFRPPGHTPSAAAPAGVRLLLKTFDGPRHRPVAALGDVREQPDPVRASFPAFARSLAGDGFAFLHQQMQSGDVDDPVLVAVEDARVVGAIGPMQTMPDPAGTPRLLPQYFGVLPEARGRGHGRTLWRAAMHWGAANGAAYQLLQTEIGGPSEQLYRTEELTTLGFIYTHPAQDSARITRPGRHLAGASRGGCRSDPSSSLQS
jgi:GNAT superfamily N-acetyltransferase